MDKGYVVQCQSCGKLHRVQMRLNIEDELFITLKCPRCRDETKHLYIGEHYDDVYWSGNCNLDPRYFEY